MDELSLGAGQQQTVQLMEVVEDYYPCSALELPVRKGKFSVSIHKCRLSAMCSCCMWT